MQTTTKRSGINTPNIEDKEYTFAQLTQAVWTLIKIMYNKHGFKFIATFLILWAVVSIPILMVIDVIIFIYKLIKD